MKWYLVRHGETPFNRAGRIQGTMDPGLNDQGRQQVNKLREIIPGNQQYDMVSSPLRRARETADPLREELDVREYHVVNEFRELDQGYWNGLRSEVLTRLEPERFQRWEQDPLDTKPRGGESLEEVRERVREGVTRVLDDCQPPVLVVGHKVVNSMLVHLAEETPFSNVMETLPDNAALYEIDMPETASSVSA